MIRGILLATCGLALVAALAPTWSGRPVAEAGLVAPERKWRTEYKVEYCKGTLTAFTPTSLTLANAIDQHDGRTPAPARYALGPALAAGTYLADKSAPFDKFNCSHRPEFSYRVQDIRLGDVLELFYVTIGGVPVCDEICISRRYGGRIPPTPGWRSYVKAEYHNVASYLSWLEEQGLPRPVPCIVPELPPEERNPKEKASPH